MVRDSQLRKRNALAIPGWLLLVYSLSAIIYAQRFRATSDFCPDGSWVLISGTCYTVWKLLLPVVLVALGLVIGAAAGFRGRPERLEQHLHHGTPIHVGLAILISLAVVPLLLLALQAYREGVNDTVYVVELAGVPFKHLFLLAVALLLALLVLIPYALALVADVRRRNRFLEAAGAAEIQEEEDAVAMAEGLLPHEEGFVHPAEAGYDESEYKEPEYEEPEEEWPASRDEEPDEEGEAASGFYYGYRLGAVPVEDVEGVGPKYAAKLNEAGVQTTARLCYEDAEELAQRTGLRPAAIQQWQSMAELMGIKGVGPQYAEAMVRAGIGTIAELKRRSAKALAKQINGYLDGLETHVLGTAITEQRVRGWQDKAKSLRKVRTLVPEA